MEITNMLPVCGLEDELNRLAPPEWPGIMRAKYLSLSGVKLPSKCAWESSLIQPARCSGVRIRVSTSLTVYVIGANGGGLVGIGWVGDSFSPGMSDWGTGRSGIGHTGLPVSRFST